MGRAVIQVADAQLRRPDGHCDRCEGELWGAEAEPDVLGHAYCPACLEELRPKYDPETAAAVLEACDAEVGKYLSKDLRDAVWNALVKRFPVEAAG